LKASSPDIESIATDLHAVAIRLLRQVRREDDASGLTSARLSALSVLVFAGRKTLGELARVEQVSLPTMTRIAVALDRAGYIKKIVDPADRRYVYLEATARGERLLDEGRRRRVERLSRLLGELAPRERLACERALAALVRVLDSAP